jgi:hypothetical protein
VSLVYTYDTQAERTGIGRLLRDMQRCRAACADVETRQSSLEDIFVGLVAEDAGGTAMNLTAIAAIYRFEMGRTFRTIAQSVISPVFSTSLYFVVFGTAIGSRIEQVEGVSYGAFIVPGLIMLTVLTAVDLERILRHLFPEIHRYHLRASLSAGVLPRDHGGLRAGGRDQGAGDRADHPRAPRSSSST